MKVFHCADIHFCPKHLEQVDRCFGYAVDHAIAADCDVAVLAGDLFDCKLDQNSPALLAAIRQVKRLADAMPVLLLGGTLSHDAPASLDVFRYVGAKFPIHVADRIQQVALARSEHMGMWMASEGWAFTDVGLEAAQIVFSCLPSVNKAAIAASVGPERAAAQVGDLVAAVLAGWGAINAQFQCPSVVVAHGTVNGAVTEHGVPMAGLDHELSVGALWSANTAACMLGHIHKMQAIEKDRRVIAYPGSIARLHYGEQGDKGFLVWNVRRDGATYTFVPTPARETMDLTFDGAPDLDAIRSAAIRGKHVRVRYSVDEEHRKSVNREEIEQILRAAGAEDWRIESTIVPVQRQRCAGIGQSLTTADKLRRWCETTNTPPEPLLERLAALEHE